MRSSVWIEDRPSKNGTRYYVFVKVDGMSKPKCHAAGLIHADAVKIKRKMISELHLNKHGIHPQKDVTLGKASEKYLASYLVLHPDSISQAKYGVGKIVDYFKAERIVRTILPTDIPEFKDKMLEAEHNVNGLIDILKGASTFFKYCVTAGYMDVSPITGAFKGLKEKPVARFLSKEEISRILSNCPSPRSSNESLQDIVKMALLTGMRQGEIINIEKSWIDGNFERIIIPEEITKTDPRTVPINANLIPILKRNMNGTDMLFGHWTARNLRAALDRAIDRAKINGRIRFHDLRHTFCSQFLKDGSTIAELAAILGHKSLKTLKRYIHFQKNHLHEHINKLSYNFEGPSKQVSLPPAPAMDYSFN